RTYRGRDVLWWMDASGLWDQRYDEVDDLTRARRLPSPQLVGTPERATLDLNLLAAMGVELVGRWAAVRDGRALFSGGLRNVFSLADLKMRRLLDTFDEWARAHGRDADVDPPERFAPTRVPSSPRLQLDLGSGEIRSVLWATGFRPDFGWLDVPVVDAKGQLRHQAVGLAVDLVGGPGIRRLDEAEDLPLGLIYPVPQVTDVVLALGGQVGLVCLGDIVHRYAGAEVVDVHEQWHLEDSSLSAPARALG